MKDIKNIHKQKRWWNMLGGSKQEGGQTTLVIFYLHGVSMYLYSNVKYQMADLDLQIELLAFGQIYKIFWNLHEFWTTSVLEFLNALY